MALSVNDSKCGTSKLNPLRLSEWVEIYKGRMKNKMESAFFSHRVIDILNSLPQEVIHSPLVASFRYKLAKMDFARFLKGNALRD